MIPLTLQLVLFITSIMGLLGIINMILRYKLELKYALLWIVLGFSIVIISIFPKLVAMITNILDIETPVNSLFLVAIVIILIILFHLTVALSSSHTKIKELSQELGIYKNELKELKKIMQKLAE